MFKKWNPLYLCRSSRVAFSGVTKYSPFDILNDRELVHQHSNSILKTSEFVNETLKFRNLKYISAYCGFDPTADSLHLGNLISIISLIRISLIGFKPIFLVGGATGLIGDPSGKSKEREFLEYDKLYKNEKGVQGTLSDVVSNIYNYLQRNQSDLKLRLDEYSNLQLNNLTY